MPDRLTQLLQLDRLDRTERRWLGALLIVTVAQTAVLWSGGDAGPIAWHPFGAGFAPWQPITFLLAPTRTLDLWIGLVVTVFLLPALRMGLTDRRVGEALAAAWAGGAALTLGVDAAGFGSGALAGWTTLLLPCTSLVGLALPHIDLRLFGVVSLPTWLVVWGPGAFGVLWVVTAFAGQPDMLASAFALGAWSGVMAWWRWRTRARPTPPGGPTPLRRRPPTRLQVLPGGKDDEVWHRAAALASR